MEPPTKRKLTTILMADVVEYGRLMGADEAGTVRALQARRSVFTRHIQQRNGRVVDAKGDALMAEFTSVVDAVAGAVEIQREIAGKNEALAENRRMRFRIGVNLGDVVEEDSSLYGDGVNIAGRLESLAEPGGVCISRGVHDQIVGKLPLEFEYLGEHQIKTETVRAYKVVVPEGAEMPAVAAQRVGPAKRMALSSWKVGLAATAVVMIVAAGLIAWYLLPGPPPTETAQDSARSLPDKPSIAVLPFVNMSGDPEQEYFADGITDTLITDLSKVPDLLVIARNSVFRYKGENIDVRQVASELGVRYILEGGVQKSGERIRVNAQLIDGKTGNHLWADRYDQPYADYFAIQDKIAHNIVLEMNIELIEGEQIRSWRRSTNNPKSWEYYLQSYYMHLSYTKEAFARSLELVEKALELDPENVRAIVFKGLLYQVGASVGFYKPAAEYYEKALDLADRAKSVDPNFGSIYGLLGNVHNMYQRGGKPADPELAVEEYRRSVALDPNYSTGYALLAWSLAFFPGKQNEALNAVQKAFRLNPHPPSFFYPALGQAYWANGRYEEAIEANRKCLELSDFFWCHLYLTIDYMMAGRQEEALLQAQEVLRVKPTFTIEEILPSYPDSVVRERVKHALMSAGLK